MAISIVVIIIIAAVIMLTAAEDIYVLRSKQRVLRTVLRELQKRSKQK